MISDRDPRWIPIWRRELAVADKRLGRAAAALSKRDADPAGLTGRIEEARDASLAVKRIDDRKGWLAGLSKAQRAEFEGEIEASNAAR